MEPKKTELSILIPVYNTVCTSFVRQLQQQAERADIDYEIIVADDASTQQPCVEENRQLQQLPNCQYIIKEVNTGAAATRNFLARQSRYQWLLFLDCDMQLPDDQFISRYLAAVDTPVINGGISIGGDPQRLRTNLRYRYEKTEEPNHTAQCRQQRPYQSFRSTNFLIRRDVMLSCPFDERFLRSGYEDVHFGKLLGREHIEIAHIDNPLLMTDYEPNDAYLTKVERSLQTLHTFRNELQGYSPLLTFVDGIHIGAVKAVIRLWHKLFGKLERRCLCRLTTNQLLFKLYKLGYFLTLNKD